MRVVVGHCPRGQVPDFTRRVAPCASCPWSALTPSCRLHRCARCEHGWHQRPQGCWRPTIASVKDKQMRGAITALSQGRAPLSRRVLSRGCLAKVRRALVPQHLQSRALDQGSGDRGHAQGDPRRRGHCGSTREGNPSDRETAWPAPGQGCRTGGSGSRETLAYYAFPEEHWRRIRTNNPLERILREIRRRTRVVGAFPDGQSALNLAAARLRHIAGTAWSTKRYLNIELLDAPSLTDLRSHSDQCFRRPPASVRTIKG
jgi:Transposase, Mutator family